MTKLSMEEAHEVATAIQIMAEELAEAQGFERPEAEDYQKVTETIDGLAAMSPGLEKNLMQLAVEGQKIKEEMGPKAYAVYKEVMEEISIELQLKIRMNLEAYTPKDTSIKGVKRIIKSLIEESITKLNSNKRIKKAFAGKKHVLKKLTDLFRNGTYRFVSDALDRAD